MEINSDVRIVAVNMTVNEGASEHARAARLPEGTVIAGEIVDLTPDTVTIATPGGNVTANLRGGPIEAKIGDTAAFTVKYDASGNPVPEFNRIPKEMIQKADVSDALVSAGFKASPENISMALELLNNGLPLTKENLLKMNQALKLLGPDKAGEALFMLKNNLRVGPRTAEALEKLLAGEAKLLGQLSSLEAKIAGVKEPALREQLTKLFHTPDPAGEALREIAAEPEGPGGDPAKAAGKLMRALKELAPKDLGRLAEGLRQMLDSPKAGMLNRPEFASALAKELGKAEAGVTVTTETSAPGTPTPEKDGASPAGENAPASAEKAGSTSPARGSAAPADKIGSASPAQVVNPGTKEMLTELLNSKIDFFKMLDDNEGGFERLRAAVKSGALDPEKPEDILRLLKIPIKPEELSSNELRYLTERLVGKAENKNTQTILDKLRFDPHNTDPADIDKFLGELREGLMSARGELLKHSTPEAANLMKDIADITNNIELTAQLKSNLFIQLPMAINSHELNAELFVFKDGKKKRKTGSATALVALDTVNLGRTETYIQKTGNTVNLQFRVKSDEVERVILQSLDKLNAGLKAHALNLQAYSFKRLTEDFTLIKEQSELTDDTGAIPAAEDKGREGRMTVFDLRL